MSDFYNKYPYTDFHELNLDWIIERVKQLTSDWLETKEAWENTEADWQELYNYVHDYFDNLNVQTEINNKIDAMILDGTFQQIATPIIQAKVAADLPGVVSDQINGVVATQINGAVAGQIDGAVSSQIGAAVIDPVDDWLTAHITQPTTPVVDDTLTITGAAADAAATGDRIRAISVILPNLPTPDFTAKTVNVSSGTGDVAVSSEFNVIAGHKYYVYGVVTITDLNFWNAGEMILEFHHVVSAGYVGGILSISNNGTYLIQGILNAANTGVVKTHVVFTNQNPAANTFTATLNKLFVVESDDNLKELCDHSAQSDLLVTKIKIPYHGITADMVSPDAYYPPTDMNIIDCWGDSLTQGSGGGGHPYTERLQTLVGAGKTVNNYGQGGENAESIAFRQGALGVMIEPFTAASLGQFTNISIPVSVDGASLPNLNLSGTYYGDERINIGGYSFMYRRTDETTSKVATMEAAAAGHVFDRSIIATARGEGVNHIIIICMGQNGWGYTGADPEILANIYQLMIDHNNSPYYLVVGLPTGDHDSRYQIEAALATHFGDKFVNAREYISKYGLADNSITPTAADTAAMAIGAIPPSLLYDSVHMNQYGYIAMANCIYVRGKTLGYWS